MASGAVVWHQRAPPHSRSAIGGNRTLRALRVGAPVLAAATFNMLLCFLNTRGLSISVAHVQIAEVAIIGTALFVGRRVVAEQMFIVLVLLLAYLCTLWIFSEQIDAKLVRDLIIPFAFFALGRSAAGQDDADCIVYILLLLVFAVGLFEWLGLETFLRYFDVITYYVNKGAVEIAQTRYLENNLFASGMRPEGRTLLPILGVHRVSSIFLEPVSTGNFAAIVFFWLVCRFRARPVANAIFVVICLCIIVLADGRFAAAISIVAVVAQLSSIARSRAALIALPMVVVVVLLGVAAGLGGSIIDDSLIGRLDSSGSLLRSFGPLQWFGLRPAADSTVDSGHAYLFASVGAVGVVALWSIFVLSRATTPQARMLRSCLALYICLSLAVSASMFTIKTAALLWFLYGAAQTSDLPARLLGRRNPMRITVAHPATATASRGAEI
jgi:putative polymerase